MIVYQKQALCTTGVDVRFVGLTKSKKAFERNNLFNLSIGGGKIAFEFHTGVSTRVAEMGVKLSPTIIALKVKRKVVKGEMDWEFLPFLSEWHLVSKEVNKHLFIFLHRKNVLVIPTPLFGLLTSGEVFIPKKIIEPFSKKKFDLNIYINGRDINREDDTIRGLDREDEKLRTEDNTTGELDIEDKWLRASIPSPLKKEVVTPSFDPKSFQIFSRKHIHVNFPTLPQDNGIDLEDIGIEVR